MKNLLLITILLGVSYSQCDANGDGDLNILDIIEEVNCILDGCWENTEPTGDIYGYWMMDSAHFEITLDDTVLENGTQYCGDYDEDYYENSDALVLYFNENSQGGEMNIDASFCGLDEVDISNPTYEDTWTYESNNDSLIIYFEDDYGLPEEPFEFSIETLDENNLILYVYMTDEYYGMTQEVTWWFRSVSTINESGRTIINKNNKISSLNYKKHFKSLNAISN
jgi:hypothetical protein